MKSHAAGDDDQFYSVALQVAAGAARRGHHQLAKELKALIESARSAVNGTTITPIAQPRGDLADLIEVSHPRGHLAELGGAK